MAPIKNPNTTTTSCNYVTYTDLNSLPLTVKRKPTGTVPKTNSSRTSIINISVSTASSVAVTSTTIGTPMTKNHLNLGGRKGTRQQETLLPPAKSHTTTTIQQTQQQFQQQQHKCTEKVAPIRRELTDFNDYLLNTVVTSNHTHLNNNNNFNTTTQVVDHNHIVNGESDNCQENQQRFCFPVRPIPRRTQQHQQQQQSLSFPQQHQEVQTQNDFFNSITSSTNLNAAIGVVIPTTPGLRHHTTHLTSSTPSNSISSNLNTNVTSSTQTQNSSLQLSQKLILLQLQHLQQLVEESQNSNLLSTQQNLFNNPSTLTTNALAASNSVSNNNLTDDLNGLLQRFQQLITSPNSQNLCNNNKNNDSRHILNNYSVINRNFETVASHLQKTQQTTTGNMVYETNPNSKQRETVINSASLEDVALSESSDRAQSIQSIHSNLETPTPEYTPTFEELQQRLDTSNRNIRNMQEQQQHLLRLQNTAKRHLHEMEQLRQQSNILGFSGENPRNDTANAVNDNTSGYNSIDEIHNDMISLVDRMMVLTNFIQYKNELADLLGEDAPDIIAEHEVLRRKLEELRKRDEMRTLVTAQPNVNHITEETVKESRRCEYEQEKDIINKNVELPTVSTTKINYTDRVVPIEYTCVLPSDLLQPTSVNNESNSIANNVEVDKDEIVEVINPINNENNEIVEEYVPMSNAIQQKMCDIEAMKNQLKHLKDMMETINLIETHTQRDSKIYDHSLNSICKFDNADLDRERTPVVITPRINNAAINDDYISRKVRMLDDVTNDLRAEEENLQVEKDRIYALKAQIEKCKNQAAAAAQMGAEALKRSSLTSTPTPVKSIEKSLSDLEECTHDRLKVEYEFKKKEFEILCQRLQRDKPIRDDGKTITSQAHIDNEIRKERNNLTDSLLSGHNDKTIRDQLINDNTTGKNMSQDSLPIRFPENNVGQTYCSIHDGTFLEGASNQPVISKSIPLLTPMPGIGTSYISSFPQSISTAWNSHQCPFNNAGIMTQPPLQSSFNIGQPTTGIGPTSNRTDCIYNTNLSRGTLPSIISSQNNGQLNNDPMLQQFMQTQQMLINSICQCNQLLWHQQREIDNLNQTIPILQEKILALASAKGSVIDCNLRSESMQPLQTCLNTLSNSLPNNCYPNINRAQSEQANITYSMNLDNRNSAFNNYQQQQHQYIYNKHHQQEIFDRRANNYNYNTDVAETNTTSSNAEGNKYGSLNNAVNSIESRVEGTNTYTTSTTRVLTHYNNELPASHTPVMATGPAPIFMHHHNNSIHQNNANLRTQNLQQQYRNISNSLTNHTQPSVSAVGALNNQVPPGNRANNYWDNFRSYSCQNLFPTNSQKSNEGQQHDSPFITPRPSGGSNSDGLQETQSRSEIYQSHHCDEISNKLNYDENNDDEEITNGNYHKYLRIMQRSRINQQKQQYQQQHELLHLNWLERVTSNHISNVNNDTLIGIDNMNHTADLMYHNYNISQNNKLPSKQICRLRDRIDDITYSNEVGQNPRHVTPTEVVSSLQYHQQQQQNIYQSTEHHSGNNQSSLNYPISGRLQNRDMLLRPVVDNVDYSYSNYIFDNQTNTLHLDMVHESNGIAVNEEAINGDDEDDVEEISEDIEKNLLVNALKYDKFTSKFYETIKEDVFRLLESVLLNKEQQQHNTDHSNNIDTQEQYGNYKSNILSSLKMFLKEQGTKMRTSFGQHTEHMADIHITNTTTITTNITTTTITANDISYSTFGQDSIYNIESNLHHSNDEKQSIVSPFKPENTLTDSYENENTNSTKTNVVQSISERVSTESLLINTNGQNTKNVNKKRRNQRRTPPQYANQSIRSIENNNNNNVVMKNQVLEVDDTNTEDIETDGACSLAAQQHNRQQQQSSDKDLIIHIISRLRNQIQSNALINDALLMEITKLTSNFVQNASNDNTILNTNALNCLISPKKFFSKIKKLSLPKKRDEFLSWYQQYLETTVFNINQTKSKNQQIRDSFKQNDGSIPILLSDGINADLAEADQNCSNINNDNYTSSIHKAGMTIELQIKENHDAKNQENTATTPSIEATLNNQPRKDFEKEYKIGKNTKSHSQDKTMERIDKKCI